LRYFVGRLRHPSIPRIGGCCGVEGHFHFGEDHSRPAAGSPRVKILGLGSPKNKYLANKGIAYHLLAKKRAPKWPEI